MVHPKSKFYLEAWKFGIYVSIPIIASIYYSDPETQRYWADYWQYIKYPENPNTNVREKIKQLAEEKELQREQRLAYQEQLQRLQQAAERSTKIQDEEIKEVPIPWWRRAGKWFSGSKKEESS